MESKDDNDFQPNSEEKNDEEELEDDGYLQELQLRLNQMKQERKAAENDAKLLDNRLNMLKNEEDKQWKKIEDKKKKANEKLIHLQNMADLIRQKEMLKQKNEEDIAKKRDDY